MLNIWSPADRDFVRWLCELHGTLTGELLSSDCVQAFRSSVCPYDGYEFVRLTIKPHILKRGSGSHTITAHSISYLLLARDQVNAEYKLIALIEGAERQYALNEVLRLKVTKDNAATYMTLFGHILSRRSFYFFDGLTQIDSLLQGTSPADVDRVRHTVLGLFPSSDGNRLDLLPSAHSHFLLGKYLSLKMPCLYGGHLFITRLRISPAGVPEMDNDEALNIEGIFDEDENLHYYPLDTDPALATVLNAKLTSANRAQQIASSALAADTVLQLVVLPLFAFHIFLLFAFGGSDATILAYFDRLRDSRTLTYISLFLGLSGTAIAIFRYFFIELLLYLKRFVPSRWSSLARATEEQLRTAASNLGLVKFAVVNFLEFSLRTWMALTLLLYGLANLRLPWLPAVNFGQAALSVVTRIPLVGGWLARLLPSSPFLATRYSDAASTSIQAVVGFLFSTILIGLVVRQVSLARNKE